MDIRKVFLGGLVASAVALPASAASASVVHSFTLPGGPITVPPVTSVLATFAGQTSLKNVADYGGRGQWALDTMTRAITITETGVTGTGASKLYTYSAVVTDTGTFKTSPRAYTPNQGIPNLGKTIKGAVTGKLTGTTDYAFSATSLPGSSNLGSLTDVTALPRTVPGTTSWLAPAFPAGTVFSNVTDGAYTRSYTAQAATGQSNGRGNGRWVYRNHHRIWVRSFFPVYTYYFGPARDSAGQGGSYGTQTWQESSSNGAGQLPNDGNITGV